MRHRNMAARVFASVAATGLAATVYTGTAQAQAMVVRSSGPSAASHPVGTKLPARTRVVLADRDSVTVIAGGTTRKLNGPGTFIIGSTGAAQGEAVNRLASYITRSGSANRVTAGAVRGGPDVAPDGAVPAPSVWFIENDSSGRFCHAAGKRVIMWRQVPGDEETATIVRADGGDPVAATWGESSRVKSWPQDDAPLDAGPYLVTAPGRDTAREIVFVALEELPDEDPQVTAEILIANQCTGQLDRLVSMGEAEDQPES